MPAYSQTSLQRLATVKPELQRLFAEVIKHWDNSILDGKRSVEQQRLNVLHGLSQTMDSKHLTGDAVDAAPYPQHWDNSPVVKPALTQYEVDMIHFAGFVRGVAAMLGIDIRYGGDWNMDDKAIASGFRDLDHFELHNG